MNLTGPTPGYVIRFQQVLAMACGRRPPIDLACLYLFEFNQAILMWIAENAADHSIAPWVDLPKALDYARSLTLETKSALGLKGDASKCMAAYLEAKRTKKLPSWFASLDPSYKCAHPTQNAGTPISLGHYFVADTKHTKETSMYIAWVCEDLNDPVAALPRAKVFYDEDLPSIKDHPHLVAIPVQHVLQWGVRPFPARVHRDIGPTIPNTREIWAAMTNNSVGASPQFHQGCSRTWSKDWM